MAASSSLSPSDTLDLRLSYVSATLSDAVSKLTSFEDAALLRGSTISRVLHRRGEILTNNAGSALTYDMSRVVKRIDWFISHNWSVCRRSKFRVLAYHFNFRAASVVVMVVACTMIVLMASGILPLFEFGTGKNKHFRGMYCLVVCPCIFLFTLYHWHDLCVHCPGNHQALFLDKTCIHQTDMEIQRQGILSLGAFMNYSSKMLVVYSDEYLQKLWTVYEVASFLACHSNPSTRIVMLPVSFPPIITRSIILYSLYNLAYKCLQLNITQQALGTDVGTTMVLMATLLAIPMVFIFGVILRRWERARNGLNEVVSRFDIRNARCFREEDRAVIQGNVITLMKGIGVAAEAASEQRVLEAFNDMVHQKVPSILQASLGRAGLPYHYVVAIAFSESLIFFDLLGAHVYTCRPAQHALVECIWTFALNFVILPLCVFLMACCLRRLLWLKGVVEIMYIGAATIIVVAVILLIMVACDELGAAAKESVFILAVYACSVVAIFAGTVFLYMPIRISMDTQRLAAIQIGDRLNASVQEDIVIGNTTVGCAPLCQGGHAATVGQEGEAASGKAGPCNEAPASARRPSVKQVDL